MARTEHQPPVKPPTLAWPRGGRPDDLTRIAGIGPSIERLLFDAGIFHLDQIARWSDEEAKWIDDLTGFDGRVGDERWREQAKNFAGSPQDRD